jgi:5,5'-dehydrodivanillate O-demethylase oxygenase subunit
MLTPEENELLTRIGPGTHAGELFRRYWLPVGYPCELTDEQPTKFVRILGEDLVLFKDKAGKVGLIQDHCAHRGASMLYGRVEERGIACAYHGWLYDTEGNCLETPAEPADSQFHRTVKMRAYPVQKYCGMYWTYMGPLPAPVIPNYDVWVRQDGTRKLSRRPILDCNWFQSMENSVDSAHLQILHQSVGSGNGRAPVSTTRGFIDDVKTFDFYEFPHGIMKTREYTNGIHDEHPLIFPNILRQGTGTHIRVPIDDTHTVVYYVLFVPSKDGSVVDQDEDPPVEFLEPYKTPANAMHPVAKFRFDRVDSQDYTVWETQGPFANRMVERLATSDRGVIMLREMYKREIARVQRGEDPMAIERDPSHPTIDTRLEVTLRELEQRATERRATVGSGA